MKAFTSLALLTLVSSCSAYPGLDALNKRQLSAFLKAKKSLNLPPPVNVTDFIKLPDKDHPFIAPGPNDKRGPCPGMNLLANHGYINRTGVTTLAESATACQTAFHFGYDVAVIFSFLGVFTGGNIETQQYSIGGPSDDVEPFKSADGTILFKPQGMSYSRPNFEGDTSLTRLDYPIKNDSWSFNQALYDDFVRHADKYGGGKFTEKVVAEYRYTRWLQMNATNPAKIYQPLTAFVGGGASSLFYDCYRNGSNTFVPKSDMDYFMGSGKIKYETFPPNWYLGPECKLENVVGDSRHLYGYHPVPFSEGILQSSYLPSATVNDFACHTLNFLVGLLTPKGTSEVDQRIGAALGEWGPYLGGIFHTKFGC